MDFLSPRRGDPFCFFPPPCACGSELQIIVWPVFSIRTLASCSFFFSRVYRDPVFPLGWTLFVPPLFSRLGSREDCPRWWSLDLCELRLATSGRMAPLQPFFPRPLDLKDMRHRTVRAIERAVLPYRTTHLLLYTLALRVSSPSHIWNIALSAHISFCRPGTA